MQFGLQSSLKQSHMSLSFHTDMSPLGALFSRGDSVIFLPDVNAYIESSWNLLLEAVIPPTLKKREFKNDLELSKQ